jgi:hypothetical protein
LAGLALGPAIVLAGRDPSGRIWPWALMSAVFLALLGHRLGLRYELTDDSLTARGWWGLGRTERMSLAGLDRAEVLKNLAMSVCGCGHVHVSSRLPDEGGLTILAQTRPEALARKLEALGRRARGEAAEPADPFDSLGPEDA